MDTLMAERWYAVESELEKGFMGVSDIGQIGYEMWGVLRDWFAGPGDKIQKVLATPFPFPPLKIKPRGPQVDMGGYTREHAVEFDSEWHSPPDDMRE